MMYVATSPLHTVTSGQYEQAMLQAAVKKRISIFEYLQKTYPSPQAPECARTCLMWVGGV
jgi:hypothetical protein